MAETTNVLITGANRGIGRALLTIYLSRPNHIVIAGLRNPSHETSQSLLSLPKASGTTLVLVKIDSSINTDAASAIKVLQEEHGIKHLDLVIANAGTVNYFGPTIDMPVEEWSKTFQINTIAPFLLFQATYPLLQSTLKLKHLMGKFVFISSSYGSITTASNPFPFDCAQYGASKAAMNYVARKLHGEVEDVVVFPAHPGWLSTEMGKQSAGIKGLEDKLGSVEESTKLLVEQIDGATREKTGGEFVVFDGSEQAW
ncbi:related to ketoreductase [Phialocephala subalpina]|uniref:Related to ketoreductase n=1 Tax=Phialocephala subalpina TaxID=576137 RepID=A0A1L7WBP0_9HELO|nr:related to ketoreductase [Phialocephala subalpina]